jgi:carbonic anhydrase/acetyltransferase-like protein (isoleucine patch superfamily)
MARIKVNEEIQILNQILSNKIDLNHNYLPHLEIEPNISPNAAIRNSQITGNVYIEENVHVVNAVIRADEGTPFYICSGSNIQDFAILHAYTTQMNGKQIKENLVYVEQKGYFAIYIDHDVSISHGVLIHGPCYIGKNSFIGFKATVDGANIGNNVEIGAHSYIQKTTIPDNIAIAPNAVITKPEDIEKYIIPRTNINNRIVKINSEMAEIYKN